MRATSLSAVAFLLLLPIQQADADSRTVYPRSVYRLPPERHVVEKVMPPGGGSILINGRYFTAKAGTCVGWANGDRIKLVAGDWNGACTDAVVYNMRRGRTCALWCR